MLTGLVAVFHRAAFFYERQRQRRDLGELDARALDDIGLSREWAKRETGKWFWQ